jgi:hypothetical protein
MDETSLLQAHRAILQSDLHDDDYIRCLVFREKLYALKLKLYQVVERVLGSMVEANRFNRFIPVNATLESVDPSNLLILVSTCDRFPRRVRNKAIVVKKLRNHYYGHIPELRITNGLIQTISRSWQFHSNIQEFVAIIEAFNTLIEAATSV